MNKNLDCIAFHEAGHVVAHKDNWSNITAVSLALVDADTLTYEKVCEVVEHDRSNAVLK